MITSFLQFYIAIVYSMRGKSRLFWENDGKKFRRYRPFPAEWKRYASNSQSRIWKCAQMMPPFVLPIQKAYTVWCKRHRSYGHKLFPHGFRKREYPFGESDIPSRRKIIESSVLPARIPRLLFSKRIFFHLVRGNG